jgi:hypothetical protein
MIALPRAEVAAIKEEGLPANHAELMRSVYRQVLEAVKEDFPPPELVVRFQVVENPNSKGGELAITSNRPASRRLLFFLEFLVEAIENLLTEIFREWHGVVRPSWRSPATAC